MRRENCRLWWPRELSSNKPDSFLLLFGWFFPSSSYSLDIVVATAACPSQVSQSEIQGTLHFINGKMPLFLRDHSSISVLGHCAADCSSVSSKPLGNQNIDLASKNVNGRLQSLRMEGDATTRAVYYDKLYPRNDQNMPSNGAFTDNCGKWNCGCHKLDISLEPYRWSSIANGAWIQLISEAQQFSHKGMCWTPRLHHIHRNGILSVCDVHLIIYERPISGVHFSLNSWGPTEQVGIPRKKPKWINELEQKQPPSNLDTIFLALNSAIAAELIFQRHLSPTSASNCVFPMLTAFIWHFVAFSTASISTVFYVILQSCYRCLSHSSESLFHLMLAKVFRHTLKNVHIRSCQLLYWPIFLQGSGFRSQSSAEYAHRAVLCKHSMWSNIAFDVLVGNVVGLALFAHAEAVCFWVLQLSRDITNNLLRSGCVWLMGVPAGFKLNTELAEMLGMLSLSAIQIWSTLWFSLSFLFGYFIRGLAISGILFGLTIPAALCIDMLVLATLHLSTLHWLMSLLYSQQIQALASLWRLFRGRKWNPLRRRLDSYDYTVEQHVVGSLLFTPLLLLLPTTSVFYIFFTILKTGLSFICVLLEIAISILHATPCAEIFLWMVQPRRFPSGIWFEMLPRQSSHAFVSSKYRYSDEDFAVPGLQQRKREQQNCELPETVVSVLHSNFATIGQILFPHYRNVFLGVSLSSSGMAYGILSGQRIPSSLQTRLPSTMPWMSISFREFWRICRDSVLECRK